MSKTQRSRTNRDKAKSELKGVCRAYNDMMQEVEHDPTRIGQHVANLAHVTKRLIDAVGYLAYEDEREIK